MVLWCSNCHHFLGETAPYLDLSVQHTHCSQCEQLGRSTSSTTELHSKMVQRMMYRLWEAGIQNDTSTGAALLDEALELGMRPVDIAMGLMTPLLYRVGNLWALGEITVIEQQHFSAFVEKLFSMLTCEFSSRETEVYRSRRKEVLLLNVESNEHNLGIRILELWFHFSGISAKALLPTPPLENLLQIIKDTQPKFIGLSVSMEEQIPAVLATVQAIADHFQGEAPHVMIGGFAVKSGLMPSIPNTFLIPDVRMFESLLNSQQLKL